LLVGGETDWEREAGNLPFKRENCSSKVQLEHEGS
jgi:hypothetical protein